MDARPARVAKDLYNDHVRGDFSTGKVRLAQEFIEMCGSIGNATGRVYHGDLMSATPLWIPARRASVGKIGFMMKSQKTSSGQKSVIQVPDHDLPLEARTKLTLNGWVRCEQSAAGSARSRFTPSETFVFPRPARYMPTSMASHYHDLWKAINSDDADFDHLLLITDNASDISQAGECPETVL